MNQQSLVPLKAPASISPVRLQRKCACEESGTSCARCASVGKSLQRMATGRPTLDAVPPIVNDVLASPGNPLDASTRGFMEERFGQDFSSVKVHTDATAAMSAHSVDALAYTVGRDIVFGRNIYAPQSQAGKHILAHELAHVVQQRGSASRERSDLRIEDEGAASESEAERAAADVVSGRPVRLGTANLGLHRLRCAKLLFAKEGPNPGSRGRLIGKEYEAEIISVARQQLGDKMLPGLSIPGASSQARREDCGEPKEAKGSGHVDLASSETPGIVEIAEVKIGTVLCYGVAEAQIERYVEKGNDPENKSWAEKKGIRKIKRMPMSRINFGGYRSLPGALDMLVDWCSPGVIVYKPVNKDEKERQKKGEQSAPLGATDQLLAGFGMGLIAGWRQTVPGETWRSIYQKLSQPENFTIFMGAQIPGRVVGLGLSVVDLIKGAVSLLEIAVKTSPLAIGLAEIAAVSKGEDSPTARRFRIGKAVAAGLPELVAELTKNPNLLFDTGEQFGNACGEEIGRRFADEFASATPARMGYIAGLVEGYLAAEVVMLLIGAEEIAAVSKLISKGAHALKASSFAHRLMAIIKNIRAFKAIFEAAEAAAKVAPKTRVAAGVGQDAAAAGKAGVRVGDAGEAAVGAEEALAVEAAPEAKRLKVGQ